MSGVVQRFLNYIRFDTQSDDGSDQTPSTPGQWDLANLLVDELKAMGLEQVTLTKHCFVHGLLPANNRGPANSQGPVLGLIAHLDTSPAFNGKSVRPKIHRNYGGDALLLQEDPPMYLDPKMFPQLSAYIGHDIITTDGTSVLGADDKAGIAEVMTVLETLIAHPEMPHGAIHVVFTPDGETDRGGIAQMDWSLFPVTTALTVDGDGLGEVNFENFNGAHGVVRITGRPTYTGDAKHTMINASRIAAEWISLLPANETPENTEGYEGFYHIDSHSGSVASAEIYCIIRDFELDGLMRRKAFLQQITRQINDKYGSHVVSIKIQDDYFNMKSAIEPRPQLIADLLNSFRDTNIMPKIIPVRGGTDGAYLALKGIATPNVFVGCHNCHSPYEFVSIQAMEASIATLIAFITRYSKGQCESES